MAHCTPNAHALTSPHRSIIIVVVGFDLFLANGAIFRIVRCTTRILAAGTTFPSRSRCFFAKQRVARRAIFSIRIPTIFEAFPKSMTLMEIGDDSSFFMSRWEYHPLESKRSVIHLHSFHGFHADIISLPGRWMIGGKHGLGLFRG